MTKEFSTVGVFGKRDSLDYEPLRIIAELLIKSGRQVLLEKKPAEALALGEGYTRDEIGQKSEILSGHYYTDTRCLLEGIQIRDGKEIYRNVAVNEICVSRGNSGGMIEVSVSVNKLPMSRQRADGLIVSTPTGSTAYALSVGGPMIYPSVACTLLIPVAPHSLANRPIVIPENSLIEITVTDMRDATLYFDMQDNSEVLVGDIIKASPYPHRVKILHPSRHNYFDTLCKKLHWNYLPTDR